MASTAVDRDTELLSEPAPAAHVPKDHATSFRRAFHGDGFEEGEENGAKRLWHDVLIPAMSYNRDALDSVCMKRELLMGYGGVRVYRDRKATGSCKSGINGFQSVTVRLAGVAITFVVNHCPEFRQRDGQIAPFTTDITKEERSYVFVEANLRDDDFSGFLRSNSLSFKLGSLKIGRQKRERWVRISVGTLFI
ncbi:hypothetical protein DFH09DRAFT_1077560 [Mycena vulgaris]|nr:hypothetical protein DFH09DRAFT_1077560 [Mycena vulgaris]